jgi:branched-chain amino acid transport system ATP-binding protein
MTETVLAVEQLRAGYGSSRVLDDLSFSMGFEAVGIIGRNGMGKTTLCRTIMGLIRPTSGTIHCLGNRIDRLKPEKVQRSGIAYVPQGRRLFPSLTVDEHLAMLSKDAKGKRWNVEEIYKLFPRLSDRRNHGGAELSGGEQQMLAIGRALMLNCPLIIMDEPSEGLAPTVVDSLISVVHTLVDEGHGVLIVEQNLRAAVAMAERQLVMVSGRIEVKTTASELANNRDLQQRYLGVDA